jgi:carbamoyl-phosphate synthase large subunit
MARPLTVLITSAGSRAALLECFRESGRHLDLDLTMMAADMRPSHSAACARADRSFALPPCSAPGYSEAVLEVCGEHDVDVVIPTIDTELALLADLGSRLRQRGTRVVVSERRAVDLVRNKLRTAEHFAREGIPVPRTASAQDALNDPSGWSWPLYAKPVDGSRSVGSARVRSPQALAAMMEEREGLIVQELCTGDEYTVNLYFGADGRLCAVVPHRRIEVRDGEVSKGVTCKDDRLLDLALSIAANVDGFRGPVCFQAFMERWAASVPRVTDVNARFGGGYPLAHAAGAVFTSFILREAMGEPLESGLCPFQEGLLMLRYSAEVFVAQRVQERVS